LGEWNGSATADAADQLIPVRVLVIKPGRLFKFVSKGTFSLPPGVDNPTVAGGSLCFDATADTVAGGATFALPTSGWKGLGNPAGAKGFKYKGAGSLSDPCKVILLKANVIKGVCKATGSAGIWSGAFDEGCCEDMGVCSITTRGACDGPFVFGGHCVPGFNVCEQAEIAVDLRVGAASTNYCAACGSAGSEQPGASTAKRKDCVAPASCSSACSPSGAFLEPVLAPF
jgi:hypothetical protein